MIIDKIENISKYPQIPQNISDFVLNFQSKEKFGRYELDDINYVNVESYTTKPLSIAKFEAHRKYADIQILLSGQERIYYNFVDKLNSPNEYNPDKDIIFYNDNCNLSDYVTLDGSNFVLIYPSEAHAPQICLQNPQKVIKMVVKLFL